MDRITELRDFFKDLSEYRGIIFNVVNGHHLSKEEETKAAEVLKSLWYRAGYLGKYISELTGFKTIDIDGKEYEMWAVGLQIPPDQAGLNGLGHCMHATLRAIGQFENDVESGIRDKKTGRLLSPERNSKFEVPKAFISDGKDGVALTKLEEFLHNFGIIPLIVKEQASLDKTADDKVEYYLDQADLVIILGTADDKFDGKLHPRQNVIHEVGLAQKTHRGKIIYLLEEGAEFPTNINPKVWERFKQRNMLNAFLYIIRELRALGMLIAVKVKYEGRRSKLMNADFI
jgi:hypothetical protein